jgi:hypothetical protein
MNTDLNLDYAHERALQSFRFNPLLPLQLIPPINFVQSGEPLLTIQVKRDPFPNTTFICTPRGMVGSLRKAQGGQLFIGRQAMDPSGEYANDIVLAVADYAVSRRHCCIYYQHGLFTRRQLTEDMVAFLMGRGGRLGAQSCVRWLPNVLIGEIFSYLCPRKAIYLTDCGSMLGTYVRASKHELLEVASMALLSPNAGFIVTSDSWEFADQINLSNCEVYDGLDIVKKPIPEDYQLSPVLWIAVLQGDPIGSMRECGYMALTPKSGASFRISSFETENSAAALVEYHNGHWFVQETKGNSDFGVWLNCSSYKGAQNRHEPRWVEIENGAEIRVSSSVLVVTW